MKANVIVVFTGESVETIVDEGGTSAWKLNRARAAECSFVICTRNAHTNWGTGTEPHRSAFLIGEIVEIVDSRPAHRSKDRFEGRSSIAIKRFAELNFPELWKKGLQNPVSYRRLKEIDIDMSTLRWQAMPKGQMRPVEPRIPRS